MSSKRRKKKPDPEPVLPTPVLHGSRVTLRPPAAADADAARRIGIHPEIERLFGAEADEWRELTPVESEELLEALASTDDRVTWVVDAGEGFIGSASLHGFGGDGSTVAFAIGLLDPDRLGRGLGTEVTRLVLRYAFDDLGLRQLTARVLEFNTRAIACLERCGFSPLRREPDAVTLDGVSHADVIMALGADHYREISATWDAETGPQDAP